jgi:hypothetical protein
MTKTVSRGLVIVAGLLALPGAADPDPRVLAEAITQTDPRLLRIQEYFRERNCPASDYAEDFLRAAAQHNLDWRLLPSLSMIESTGGKEAHNNNMFGWDNCRIRFRTTREGIYRVAARLARSGYYRGKNVDQVLQTYNPRPMYAERVKQVMAELGPSTLVPAGAF